MAASMGQWMQSVALGWLALTMTNSPGFVGIVSFAAGLPFLVVGPLGGTLVDRVDRRRLMLVVQAAAGVLALIVAADVFLGTVQPWHLLVAAVANGSMQAILNPTQQSIVPALVERSDLTNAIGLMSAGQNLTRLLGPSLAGIVIAATGDGPTFMLQAVALAVAFALVLRIALPRRTGPAAGSRNPLEGLRLIVTRPDLRAIVLLAFFPTLLIFPYIGFLNVFARDVLRIGPEGLGLLMGASSLGAIGGSLLVAGKGRAEGMGKLLFGGTLAYGLVIMAMTLSRTLWITLPLLVVAGFLGAGFMAGNNATIQHRTDDAVRGRVMGAYLLTWGLMPLGALPMGMLGARIGMPEAVFAFAAVSTVCTLVLGVTNRTLRAV
jgi:MFS family permease